MQKAAKRVMGTATSSFGAPGRINHDSSVFYKSKLYDELRFKEKHSFIENQIPNDRLDKIYCKTSQTMDEIPDSSIHLMITSPPYNCRKEYDDNLSFDDYRHLLQMVFQETYKKLVVGGRACINIANLGRKPYIPMHRFVIEDMLKIGFLMRGEIIWDKGTSASSSTAWGSWLSPVNPVLRDTHEYILIFSKESFTRPKLDKKSDLTKDEFLAWTKSLWSFSAVSAKKIGHPAPFPEDLPLRLIKLYSFIDDIILDPFCGSGTTCVAAVKAHRHYIGYDIEKKYCDLASKRVQSIKAARS
jgi:DNA modification methylase